MPLARAEDTSDIELELGLGRAPLVAEIAPIILDGAGQHPHHLLDVAGAEVGIVLDVGPVVFRHGFPSLEALDCHPELVEDVLHF